MEEFIARARSSIKAFNVVKAAANLPVNILIIGEPGTGKERLVTSIFGQLPRFRGGMVPKECESETVFIPDFENVKDVIAFMQRNKSRRIIAAAIDERSIYEEYFPIMVKLPPLRERPEDVEALKHYYLKKAKAEFEIEELDEDFNVDLSKNAVSLKRSVYERVLFASMDEEKLMEILEEFLEPRIDEGYKELLGLFEIPLLRAAKKRYRSVLAMSKALGLNRATLTTKLKKYDTTV